MYPRCCRLAFSFALGLILLVSLALAVQSSAALPERAAESLVTHPAPAPVSPTAAPTLTLAIAPSDDFPALGSTIRYSITLRNTGDAAANGAAMSNTLPAGLEIVTGTLAATGGAASYDPTNRAVHWAGDLTAGGAHTVTYAAVLNTAAYIYNTATISHPLAAREAGTVSSPADYWGDAEVLDSAHNFANTLGGYRHIVVDAAGVPHIAYGGNNLFYATAVTGSLNAAETAAAGWRIETAVAVNASQAALVLDDQGRALIAYASGTSLWLARQTTAAAGSAWTTARIVQYPSWTLQNKLDLRRGGDGRLHLAYTYDNALYYAVHDGAAWSAPAVVVSPTACDSSTWGAGFSLALDAANVAHIACVQSASSPRELRLFTAAATAPWPVSEVITSRIGGGYRAPSLTYDGNTPHVAFFANYHDIYYATKGATWQTTRLEQPAGGAINGSSTALDIRGGQIAIAYSYDAQVSATCSNTIRLGSRPLAGGAWNVEIVDAFRIACSSADWVYPSLALDGAGRPHLAYYHATEPSLRYAALAEVGEAAKREIASQKTLAMTTAAAFAFQTVDESRRLGASAVAVGRDGGVRVAYLSGGVRYLVRPPGTRAWVRTLAVPGVDDSFASELDLALDAVNGPHIVYSRQGGPLYHAIPSPDLRGLRDLEGLVATWLTRTVDTPGNLAAHPSISAEAAGTAQIAYLAAEGANRVLRHAALASSTWQTTTLTTVGPVGSTQFPQLVAHGGKVHILYFDCTAHQATGDYPIHLMLKTLADGGWTARDLYQWDGRCTESSGSQLLGSETGGLTALLYAFSGGRWLVGEFVIEPDGVAATVETDPGEFGNPKGLAVRAVWEGSAHVPGNSELPGTSEVIFANRAALAAGEAEMGRAPDLVAPLGGGWWYYIAPRQSRGPGTEGVELRGNGKYAQYYAGGYSSAPIPVGTGTQYGQITPNNLARTGQTFAAVETTGNSIAVEAPTSDCCLKTAVEPSAAVAEGCNAEPPIAFARCNTSVQVTAKTSDEADEKGWRFVEWTGAASGPLKTTEGLVAGKHPACSVATAHFLRQAALAGKIARPSFYAEAVAPEEEISYVISLSWESSDGKSAKNNSLADAIPPFTDYVPGSVWASKGKPQYTGDRNDGTIHWPVGDVEIESGETVQIGFRVKLDYSELPASRSEWPSRIVNIASGFINGSFGYQEPNNPTIFVFNPIVNTTADTVAGDPHDGKCGQDGGPCSLREALEEVNYHPNRALPDGTPLLDVVSFRIADFGLRISDSAIGNRQSAIPLIPIHSALPAISDPAIIDGNSQPGYIGFNRVQLDGSAGAYDGLRIRAGGSTVRGLVLTNFGPLGQGAVGHGIVIEVGGGNVISDTLIGTTGADNAGNRGDGIRILGSAGNLLRRNVIGHNLGSGVVISGTAAGGNRLEGNQIGIRKEGATLTDLGNLGHGVLIQNAPDNTVGGAASGARNLIGDNFGDGVALRGAGARGNVVAGNIVGEVLGNWRSGVAIVDGAENRVGGTLAEERNIISANGYSGGHGVVISGSQATANVVLGNYIGLLADGLTGRGNYGNGVLIAGGAYGNTIGGATQSSRNVISGNRANGISITSGARGNTVAANYIGIDALGTQDPWGGWLRIPNLEDGILIEDAPANLIGQPITATQNVISGNRGDGIEIRGAASAGTVLQWNFIGLFPDALGLRTNGGYGIFINGAPRNRIGGTTTLESNHIAGNRAGVVIQGAAASENVVIGNCIGLGWVSCFGALATQTQGVLIQDAPRNRIGGAAPGERNTIAAAQTGVELRGAGATGNVIEGNFIGTEREGREARQIGKDGVRIQDAADNTIGGLGAGRGNLISGANGSGVVITGTGASGNRLLGNLIGTNADGSRGIGNENGVLIGGVASGNQIGGTEAGAGNVIAFNRSNGVVVGSGVRNAILGNRVFANTLLGIDLAPPGLTPNDRGDGDSGPNGLQNFPLLASTVISSNTTISATLNSRPGAAYRVEFFANPRYSALQGEQFLGSLDVTTDAQGNAAFERTFSGPQRVLAMTATDRDGNTSEFSAAPLVVNTTGDEEDASADDGMCDVDLARQDAQCTLRAAIEEANRRKGTDTITFDIDTSSIPIIRPEGDLPDLEDRIVIDGTSQRNTHQIQIDGSEAGEAADGLNITGPHAVLSGLIISSFERHGIRAEQPAQLDLDHLEIRDNLGWGIYAAKPTSLYITHAEITNNGVEEEDTGGIFVASGFMSGEDLLVSDNAGDGIRCNGSDGIHLANATIEHNREDGLQAYGFITLWGKIGIGANGRDGIYGMRGLALAEVETLDVIGNGRWGIYLDGSLYPDNSDGMAVRVSANGFAPGDGGGIRIREGDLLTGEAASFEVSGNDGPGIRVSATCDVVALDDATIRGNTGDGVNAWCEEVELTDHVTAADNGGHGIFTSGNLLLRGDSLVVTGNGGWGVYVGGTFGIHEQARGLPVTINANRGGIRLGISQEGGDLWGKLAGTFQVCHNRGDGIRNLFGGVSLAGATICDNRGWGIWQSGGRLNLGASQVISNTLGAVWNGGQPETGATGESNSPAEIEKRPQPLRLAAEAASQFEIGDFQSLEPSAITASDLRANGGDGVRWEATAGLAISGTNIAGNAGLGVNNISSHVMLSGSTTQDQLRRITSEASRQSDARPFAGESPRSKSAGLPAQGDTGEVSSEAIEARGNWWGAASGPGGVGPGAGDAVSAGVSFTPWLVSPVVLALAVAEDPLLASVSGAATVNLLHLRSWLGVTDTLTVTVTDSRGWRVGPASFAVALPPSLGAAIPITFAVAAGTPAGTPSLATVTATSRVSPTVVATATFPIVAAALADVALEKTAPREAVVGRPLTYTLVVSNRGPDAATGVVLTDTLPVSVTLLSAAPGQGSCAGVTAVVCNLGALAPGQVTTVTLTARPWAAGVLGNRAGITAATLDPAPWDNRAWGRTFVAAGTFPLYLPLVLR